jgi:hypothetical protein
MVDLIYVTFVEVVFAINEERGRERRKKINDCHAKYTFRSVYHDNT